MPALAPDFVITAYLVFVAGVVGLIMGSFVNCWAWRSLRGESIVRGRSHCTSCGHELGARDLVPIASWVASHGACRYCGAKVSARYPATEAVCAIVFMLIAARYGLSLETVELMAFAGVLLFLSLTDLDEYIIPNGCIVVALVVRAVYLAAAWALGTIDVGALLYYIGSGVGVGAVMLVLVLVGDKVFGRESMGGGDLKLYAVAGFYFGWQQSLLLVLVSCIIGIVVALATGKGAPEEGANQEEGADRDEGVMKKRIPFGPSIAAACVLVMLAGGPVINWYVGLM